jgi:hypothetical protein
MSVDLTNISQTSINVTTGYDFTSAEVQVYGSNMVLKGGKYCLYSGDVNHDNNVNLLDLIAVDNDNTNIITGYVDTDVNGDNIVNLLDLIIVDNNNTAIITRVAPTGAPIAKIVKQPLKSEVKK